MTIRRLNVQTGEVEILNEDAPSFPEPATARGIKAEARRRILEVAPEWKQMNRTARSVELLDKGRANLTTAEKVEVTEIEAMWTKIKAIRTASDRLEAMLPDVQDFKSDRHWPK